MSQQLNCKSTVERAFEIADSGQVSSIDELGRFLDREGYALNMLTGPELLKQLRKRIAKKAALALRARQILGLLFGGAFERDVLGRRAYVATQIARFT